MHAASRIYAGVPFERISWCLILLPMLCWSGLVCADFLTRLLSRSLVTDQYDQQNQTVKLPSITLCNDGMFLGNLVCYKGSAYAYMDSLIDSKKMSVPCQQLGQTFILDSCFQSGGPMQDVCDASNVQSSFDGTCLTVNPVDDAACKRIVRLQPLLFQKVLFIFQLERCYERDHYYVILGEQIHDLKRFILISSFLLILTFP